MSAKVIDLETRDVSPIPTGRYRPSQRLPMFRRRDDDPGCIPKTVPCNGLPFVVNRRFLSGARSARVVTTYFSDEFCMVVSDSVWPTQHLEIVGNENEWIVLSLRLSGETLESVGGRHYRLDAYSCYLVHYAPGMRHVLGPLSDEPLAEVCITFSPSLLARKLGIPIGQLRRLLALEEDGGNASFSRCDLTARMEEVINVLRHHSLFEPTYRIFAEAKALELIALYIAEVGAQALPVRAWNGALSRDLRRLRLVRRHLEDHYDSDLRIDDLCRIAGFTRRKLTSAFRREFGITIHDYRQRVRMEIAKALFRGGRPSVSDVAGQVGYAYPGNFSKAFQQHTGVLPKAFMKRYDDASIPTGPD